MPWIRREKQKQVTRTPHPDPRTEAELQRIIGLRAVIARQEGLCAEYRAAMASARHEQEKSGKSHRSISGGSLSMAEYEQAMRIQQQRIDGARIGLREAEDLIIARQAEITGLMEKLADADLAFL